MNKIAIVISMMLLFSMPVLAETGTLGTPLTLQPLDAYSVDIEFYLGTTTDAVRGKHRWRAADNSIIYLPESRTNGWITWTLRNHTHDSVPGVSNLDCTGPATPDACCADAHPNAGNTCDDAEPSLNADCEALGDPYGCCTQENVGVCEAWSDTALFSCGTTACDGYIIGVGLRTLIINQWKKLYAPGVNITF